MRLRLLAATRDEISKSLQSSLVRGNFWNDGGKGRPLHFDVQLRHPNWQRPRYEARAGTKEEAQAFPGRVKERYCSKF